MIDFNDPSSWPRDTKQYVFLARALNQVGKALYREEWTGDDPQKLGISHWIHCHWTPKRAHYQDQWKVQKYLERNHPKLAQPHPGSVGELPPPPFRFSPEGWEVATQHFNEKIQRT